MAVNADNVFRDFVIDGAPSSGAYKPKKVEIRELFSQIDDAIGAAAEGLVVAETWSVLATITGTRVGQPAEVPVTATGTHTDPVTGTVVPNTGLFRWSASPAGWRRVGEVVDVPSLNRRAVSILGSVSGTANAITATDLLSTADQSNDPATSYILIPATTNTGPATLAVNGDTPRPIRSFGNEELLAGDLVAGVYYLIISDGGRFRVFSGLGASPPRNVNNVITTLAAGTAVTDPTNTQVVLLNADGTASQRISWTSLLAKINEDFMGPTKYRYKSNKTVGTTPVEIIATDSGLKGIRLQNTSDTAFVALAFNGATPVLNGSGSYTIPPLGLFSEDDIIPGQVKAISNVVNTPITCEFLTTTNTDPNSNAAANALLARYTGTLTTDRQNAIRTFYQSLYSRGLFDSTKRLMLFNFIAPNTADARMDWAGGSSATAVATPAFTAFTGYSFDGSTQYLDTGRMLSSIGTLDDYTMMVDVDTTIQATNATAIGDGTSRIQPNRNSTSARFNSVAATGDVVTGFVPGGLFGMTRRSATEFEVFQNSTFNSTVTRTAGSLSTSLNILVGAGSSSSTVQNFYAGTIRMALVCRALSRADEIAVAQAWATFKTSMGV